MFSLGWLKFKRLEASNIFKDMKQLEFSYIADGSIKWYNHFENQFGGFS
jgi:hypothetical protein